MTKKLLNLFQSSKNKAIVTVDCIVPVISVLTLKAERLEHLMQRTDTKSQLMCKSNCSCPFDEKVRALATPRECLSLRLIVQQDV